MPVDTAAATDRLMRLLAVEGVTGQEAAIGRTKLSDIELPDSEKAPDAHVALNVLTNYFNRVAQPVIDFPEMTPRVAAAA